MIPNSSRTFLAVVMALTLGAGLLLLLDGGSRGVGRERSQELQSLLGGLGFGPALDISACEFSFDPRAGNRCSADQGPIPGGTYFCSQHANSILYYPALAPRGEDSPPKEL